MMTPGSDNPTRVPRVTTPRQPPISRMHQSVPRQRSRRARTPRGWFYDDSRRPHCCRRRHPPPSRPTNTWEAWPSLRCVSCGRRFIEWGGGCSGALFNKNWSARQPQGRLRRKDEEPTDAAIIRKFSIRKWCGALTPPTFPPIRKSNKKVGAVPLDLSHI